MTLSERLRSHVVRLPDGHSTKRLCLEAAGRLDALERAVELEGAFVPMPPVDYPFDPSPAPVVKRAERRFVCMLCGEFGMTALNVCPDCGGYV